MKYKSSSATSSCCLSSDHFDKIRSARAYKRQERDQTIRLLVTIGGGGRSNGFNDVLGKSNTQAQRKLFLDALVQFCLDEELDGIDFDHEGIQSREDWNAYLNFLPTATSYLHRHGLLLTVALHPQQLLPEEVCRSVDRVHVMTYDMMSSGGKMKHHAPLPKVKRALTEFIENGCPPSKLVMGIPAYGRHGQNAGLVKTYSEVVDELTKNKDDDDVREIMSDAIQHMHNWDGYLFDSPDDVRAKVKYARKSGLGGIFIWELGQDKQMVGFAEGGILLEAAAAVPKEPLLPQRDEL